MKPLGLCVFGCVSLSLTRFAMLGFKAEQKIDTTSLIDTFFSEENQVRTPSEANVGRFTEAKLIYISKIDIDSRMVEGKWVV